MRILAITPYYAPEGGGLERYAHEILHRLDERGHEVQALAFTGDDPGHERREGVEIERRSPSLVLGSTPLGLGFPGHVRAMLDRFAPDVVVAHTPVPFPAEAAYLAARGTGIPFVTTYHAGELTGSSPLLDALAALDRVTLQRAMLAGSQRLIAVSPYVREHALSDHREQVTVIPPGVDRRRFTPNGAPDGPRILFVGPLSNAYRWKGLDVLLDAFEQVRARVPETQLELVGDGDRFEEIQRRADAIGGIELSGHVSDAALAEAYQRASVVTLPSTSPAESFGMVLAEANACQRPVVASRVGGIPSFVRDGVNGHLAQPGEAEDLAAKLASVLEHPDRARRMGERGRRIVEREHDWEALTERTERVLAQACGR